MYYLQSRYYDPKICRFINADAMVSTGQGILGNNMYSYCHNNPVLYVDPSGFVIVVSDEATQEQKDEYERAIAYLKTSATGLALIDLLESSSEVFTIVFNDNNDMRYSGDTKTIFFDTNSGLVVGNGKEVQSAALGLAHEMGHAAQDLTGALASMYYIDDYVESHNLKTYETPIAEELGEPTRASHSSFGFADMQNSTHYRTTSPRSFLQPSFPGTGRDPVLL